MKRISHIRNERATREATGRIGDGRPLPRRIGVGWCGVDCSSEWFFMDADTLLLDLAYGGMPVGIEPCAACVKAMADLLATCVVDDEES